MPRTLSSGVRRGLSEPCPEAGVNDGEQILTAIILILFQSLEKPPQL
jgi:hypothetical protein